MITNKFKTAILTREPDQWDEIRKSLDGVRKDGKQKRRFFRPRTVTTKFIDLSCTRRRTMHPVLRQARPQKREYRHDETKDHERENPKCDLCAKPVDEARHDEREEQTSDGSSYMN